MMRASRRQPKYLYGFGAVRLSRELQAFKFRQSEAESQARVQHTSFQQCPRVDGPFPVEVLLGPQQRVVTGLANIQEIFRIHKDAGWSEPPFDEHAEDPVRHALGAIWIVFQALPARIEEFETDPAFRLSFPGAHDACGVFGCQRNEPPLSVVSIDFS